MNAMQLSLKSDTFSSMKEDFDAILARTIGNMEMKGAEDATITLKLSIALERTSATISGEPHDFTRPSFKHDISSVMQVKDKKSGALTGDYQLVYDENEKKYVMKRIEDGQVSMFDNGTEVYGEVVDAEEEGTLVLEEGQKLLSNCNDLTDKESEGPFEWLKKFVGSEMYITENAGRYAVRTFNDDTIITSSTSPDSVFYCSEEKLAPHVGHNISCVGYGGEEIINISIECEDCNEVLFNLELYPEVETELVDDTEGVPDYEYAEPEEDL